LADGDVEQDHRDHAAGDQHRPHDVRRHVGHSGMSYPADGALSNLADEPEGREWRYPPACEHGHPWAPERIIVAWEPCECPPAVAAREHGPGHLVVHRQAPGCRSAWYKPRHERGV
jgi:hypothetical protein